MKRAAVSVVTLLVLLHLLLRSAASAAAGGAAPTAASGQPPTKQYAEFQPCSWPQFDDAIQHFSEILQFQTVGNASLPEHADPVVWELLDLWLRDTYSSAFQALKVEKLGAGNLSYLLTWPGSSPQLDPVLFVAHTDVVPVEESTLKDWTHPPFSGAVADGFVWGRGAMDVKVLVVLLLEAVTSLLAEGFTPQRTLMFAFGHDEELTGSQGAALMSAVLASRGVQLEVLVDEGPAIAMDGLPGLLDTPLAVVGTAEKAYLQVEVTLSSKGGHSSMPPIDGSSIGDMLGRFLSAMSSQPGALELTRPTSDFLAAIAQLLPAGLSHVLGAVSWLPPVRWLLAWVMTRVQAETAAMVRTTGSVTRVQAGTAHNVLPQTATVSINFRLLPGHSADTAVRLVKGWLGRDAAHAQISVLSEGLPQMRVADASGPHFAILKAALQRHWRLQEGPQGSAAAAAALPVLPALMPAVTDSRHYLKICPNGALRFTPYTARRADHDYNRLHGVDERLRLSDFACALNTYRDMVRGFGDLLRGQSGGREQRRAAAGSSSSSDAGSREGQREEL